MTLMEDQIFAAAQALIRWVSVVASVVMARGDRPRAHLKSSAATHNPGINDSPA
jgi:hypothetical protein